MRRFVISMIAVFGVIALGLIILMVSVINSGGLSISSSYSTPDVNLVSTRSFNMDGIEVLSLDYSSDDIIFYESDTTELVLKEYMNITPNEKELSQIKQSGSKLRLQGGDRMQQNWIFRNYRGYVEVYLPAGYPGSISSSTSSGNIETAIVLNLSEFTATSSSGDISFNEVYAPQISAATTSGNIMFDKAEGKRSFTSSSGNINIQAGNGDTKVSSTSGNITIKDNTGELNAEASSGNITIEAAVGVKEVETTSGVVKLSECIGYLKAASSSGDIIISDLGSAGTFETTSGNIKVSFTEELVKNRDDIEATSSSGEVKLKLPSSLNFDFEAKTSSGDIDTFFDDSLSYKQDGDYASGTVGADPDFQMKLVTTSGNITVED